MISSAVKQKIHLIEMARSSTRRSGKGMRVVRRVYSPISHFLKLTGATVGVATNTARNIVQRSIRAVNSVGTSVANHSNATLRNLMSRRRSSRRSTRRNNRR
jgi:hypothetical protein